MLFDSRSLNNFYGIYIFVHSGHEFGDNIFRCCEATFATYMVWYGCKENIKWTTWSSSTYLHDYSTSLLDPEILLEGHGFRPIKFKFDSINFPIIIHIIVSISYKVPMTPY